MSHLACRNAIENQGLIGLRQAQTDIVKTLT